jgi:hypothetical protein
MMNINGITSGLILVIKHVLEWNNQSHALWTVIGV